MTEARETPNLDRLEELEHAVRQAEQRVAELTAERGRASRSLDRAMGPLRDYHEAVGAGEREPDADQERELVAAVRAAGEAISFEPVHTEGRLISLQPVDERVAAQLRGAERKLVERRGELEQFRRRTFAALAEELAPIAQAAQRSLQVAWDEADRASGVWTAVVRRWQPLLEAGGLSVEDLPGHPFAGLNLEIDQGVPLPMPRSLWPEDRR